MLRTKRVMCRPVKLIHRQAYPDTVEPLEILTCTILKFYPSHIHR